MGKPASNKLARRYFGPYEITERVGKVAYRLLLPADSMIHDVFHVSLLKKFVPFISATMDLPASFRRSNPLDSPISASATRTVLVKGVPQEQWLVGWASDDGVVPSWEPMALLKTHFPDLHREDKVALVDGGVDRDPTVNEETQSTSPREEQPDIERQVQQTVNKPKTVKKAAAQARRDHPKRTRSRPSKYKDFVSR